MNIWSILNDNTILQQWNFTCSNSQIDLDSLHGWIMKLEIPASQSMMPSTKLRNYNHLSRDQILKLHKTKKLQTFFPQIIFKNSTKLRNYKLFPQIKFKNSPNSITRLLEISLYISPKRISTSTQDLLAAQRPIQYWLS